MSNAALLQAEQLLVFEGDSLTRRQMAPCADTWPLARINGWDHSYGEMVEEWLFANLPALRLKARHAAIGGSPMTGVADRYENQVKPLKPSWIFLTIGSNDMNRGVKLDDFRATVSRYVQTAQQDSGARFFYAGGFLPMPGVSDRGRESLLRAQPYYDAARQIIRDAGGLAPHMGRAMLQKAEQLFAGSDYHTFYADGNHLNGLGNRVLASLVLQALGAYELLSPLSE